VFRSITITGTTGSIVWGYQDAARLSAWSIRRHAPDATHDGRWLLTAHCAWIDAYRLRQRRLLFTAPRDKGRWCWLLKTDTLERRGPSTIVVQLGPPEQ
jgi:hypothetical protein